MTRDQAQRIIKGFLAGLLMDGTFADAIHNAELPDDDAHELRNAAMAVAYEMWSDAGVGPGSLGDIVRTVAKRAQVAA